MSYSLEGFAALLIKATVLLPAAEEEAMKKAAVMLEKEAKTIIGTDALAANAAATIDRKGFDAPGLATGEMRDSITHNADRHEAYIGSDNEKLKWLEFGTQKAGSAWGSANPPRPVLGLTVVKHGEHAAEIVGREVTAAITIL
jgi:phage gpG-like protein